ncbi:MAG: glycosyltransferase [Saprospiraceae bacterium]|nr:glycosyltransferase [Saprospiraceae bacterium]
MKILYIVKNYPQITQTYIKSELNALVEDYEIEIIATSVPNVADPEHLPYHQISDIEQIIRKIQEFKPDFIHSHYLLLAELVSGISQKTGIPFTIRAHSFDAMQPKNSQHIPKHISTLHNHVNHDLCRGVLIFPFTRTLLVKAGPIDVDKLVDAPPVIDASAFLNKAPNGHDIINVGACIPKKGMEDFVLLSTLLPEYNFNLYGVGHTIDKIKELNLTIKGRVNTITSTPFSKMPAEYKKHAWLVYTANASIGTVGWPMAVMEAMASGTMVCMPRVREDISDFLGDEGYIYDDIRELPEILRRPIDEAKRTRAFDRAMEFDIVKHISKLTDLWE